MIPIFPQPSHESPPMFDSRFIDRFSRTHFSVVAILYVPATAVLLWIGLAKTAVPWWITTLLTFAGFVAWTLTEYWLHRKFFHWTPEGKWGERMHFLVHGVHHRWPRDRYRLVMPPAVSISLFWIFLGLYWALMGDYCWGFMAGYAVGYMYYDLMHYCIHHVSPRWEWMRKLRRHHLEHHSPKHQHEKKFGVSITIWDHVFRTYS